MIYDVIICDGLWFDGIGNVLLICILGICDGVVVMVVVGVLDEIGCLEVVDVVGKWVVFGFIDVYIYYDVEVLFDFGLWELVCYGVIMVLLGNCLLLMVYVNFEDVVDLFSCVEVVFCEFVLGVLWDN